MGMNPSPNSAERLIYSNVSSLALIMLLLSLGVWWIWVAPLFETTQAHTAIQAISTTAKDYSIAQQKSDLTRFVVPSSNSSVDDRIDRLEKANQELEKTQDAFEKAGSDALSGELIVLSGLVLQVVAVLAILYVLRNVMQFVERRVISASSQSREAQRESPNVIASKEPQAPRSKSFLDKIVEYIDDAELRDDLRKQISTRNLLDPEQDAILRYIRDEPFRLPPEIRARSRAVAEEYAKLTSMPLGEDEEPVWRDYSKLLFHIFRLCHEGSTIAKGVNRKTGEVNQEDLETYEDIAWKRYRDSRAVLDHQLVRSGMRGILMPTLFLFLFEQISTRWNTSWGAVTAGQLGWYLSSWHDAVIYVAIAFLLAGFIYVFLAQLGYWLTEKTWTDLDDIIVSVTTGPVAASVIAIFIMAALASKGEFVMSASQSAKLNDFAALTSWISYMVTKSSLRSLVLIFVLTWLAVVILNKVVVWGLEKWSQKTTQIYDDVFVKIIQVFGTFMVLAFGIGAGLAVLSGPLRAATGVDNVLLPYSIVVSVFTALLGYASRAGIENFFGGLLLQIEKPFEKGEQIVLPDKQIYDVRDVGMRSTRLYNVLENTEVSVPNVELSRMTITNISRPDRELRVAIPLRVSQNAGDLKEVEAMLLDAAYLENEVDKMQLAVPDSKQQAVEKMSVGRQPSRISVAELFKHLYETHDKIRDITISRVGVFEQEYYMEETTGESSGYVDESHPNKQEKKPDRVFRKLESEKHPYEQVLQDLMDLRIKYRALIDEEDAWIVAALRKHKIPNDPPRVKAFRHAVTEAVSADTSNSHSDEMKKYEALEAIENGLLEKVIGDLADGIPTIHPAGSADPSKKVRDHIRGFEMKRQGLVLTMQYVRAKLMSFLSAIDERFPDLRADLEPLGRELDVDPTVLSEYLDNGNVKLTLLCSVMNSRRKPGATDKLNAAINDRLRHSGVRLLERSNPVD